YEMIEAILKDQKRLLPSIAYLEGEYGFSDICLGVPTILSKKGIEKIVEVNLNDKELEQLKYSAESVENVKNALKNK
ncbi:malate dehydrogenase, partial [Staphylococcus epidermidis]